MEGYGIQGSVLRWIARWLEDRQQRLQLDGNRLGWTEVRGCVPEGSGLGPLLYTIIIYETDEEVLCEISKFADDTKIASRVNILNDIRSMQKTLDKLVAWANRWKMDFNVNKWNVYREKKFRFPIPDEWWVDEERDLRVLMSKDFKFSKNKANLMLGIINRGVL